MNLLQLYFLASCDATLHHSSSVTNMSRSTIIDLTVAKQLPFRDDHFTVKATAQLHNWKRLSVNTASSNPNPLRSSLWLLGVKVSAQGHLSGGNKGGASAALSLSWVILLVIGSNRSFLNL